MRAQGRPGPITRLANLRRLITVFVAALVILLAPAAAQDRLRIRDVHSASASAQLAAIEDHSLAPPLVLVDRFREALRYLLTRCTETDAHRIADFLVHGRDLLKDKGIEISVLRFTDETVALLRSPNLATFHASCQQPTAAVVTILEASYEK